MKRFFTLLFVFSTLHFYGQNLVINGSFEDFVSCPDDQYEIDQAEPWKSYGFTPDFFHVCDETNTAGVPYSSIYGYQQPLVGEGQAGFIALGFVNNHEVIGAPLSENLIVGNEYYVSFYVSRGFGGGFHSNCNCAINNIGLKFLTEEYSINEPLPIDNQADILYEEVIIDTVGWTHVSGWFTADVAYSHIAIGNFFDAENNIIENYNDEQFYKTYYFLDEVCISDDASDCLIPTSTQTQSKRESLMRIFPNPNEGSFQLNSEKGVTEYSIQNLAGQVMISKRIASSQNVIIDASDLPAGIYLISVKSVNGEFFQSKIVKN